MPISSTAPVGGTIQQRFAAACHAHGAGELEEALEKYQQLISELPPSGLLQYNLGLVYFGLSCFDLALRAFSLADTLAPGDSDTLFNLALCRRKTGNLPAAIATYRQVLAGDGAHIDSLYNLGGCYHHLHDDIQARECYRLVLELDPTHLSALKNLAYLLHRAAENEQAIALYGRFLALRPEDESVRYLLAALAGVPLDHAPDVYVRDFFDAYAEHFEQSLVEELGYENPQRLYECLCRTEAIDALPYAHGLDLGCGTGLAGVRFKEKTAMIDGVDLSPAMLAVAAAKGCYHTLWQDSISHFLHSTTETFDFFLATDVFIYVGALLDIFIGAHAAARPGALFCFSTEHANAPGFRLLPTGRFAYSPGYIHELALGTGWIILAQEPSRLRREREAWIIGDLWILQRAELPAD